MTTTHPCLHCAIMDLIDRWMIDHAHKGGDGYHCDVTSVIRNIARANAQVVKATVNRDPDALVLELLKATLLYAGFEGVIEFEAPKPGQTTH